jgi:hypothetical protein
VKGSMIWPDCQIMFHSDRSSVSGQPVLRPGGLDL